MNAVGDGDVLIFPDALRNIRKNKGGMNGVLLICLKADSGYTMALGGQE
ncbi:MAG: hypothetical protein IAE95_12740 [Chitinophagaceae bacterium]|nr:hypothetical protein [Chitinophagaceae bacterium]